jgi:hypothetical protein
LSRYYQLSKFGRVARITAGISLFFTAVEIGVFFFAPVHQVGLLIMTALQLPEEIAILLLGTLAGLGSPKAFFGILVAAGLAPVQFLLFAVSGVPGFACDFYPCLPMLFLIFICKESMPEVRQLIRRRREDLLAGQRGFTPIINGENITVKLGAIPVQSLPSADVPQTMPVDPPIYHPVPRRLVISHYMHAATQTARVVGLIQLTCGLLLLIVNFAFALNSGHSSIDGVMSNVLIYYALPAIVLLTLAWRMDHRELWAYVSCAAIAVGLMVRLVISIAMLHGFHQQRVHFSFFVDWFCRLPSLYLLMRCVYSIPDAWDMNRQRRRERSIERKRRNGTPSPASPLASVAPPPPSGTRALRKPSSSG